MTARACEGRRPQAGLTLMEVMIALGILSFMMTMAWAATSRTAETKADLEEAEERIHEIRMGMNRMVRDLSHAYISANEEEREDPRTLFRAGRDRPVSELRFSTLAKDELWAEAAASEQTMIEYTAEPDPDEPAQTNVVRRELRRLPTENYSWREIPAEVDLLVRDVDSLQFEYYDWREEEWQEGWDTTTADREGGRLPTRVRIELTVSSRGEDEITYTSQARVALQEELNFLAN